MRIGSEPGTRGCEAAVGSGGRLDTVRTDDGHMVLTRLLLLEL